MTAAALPRTLAGAAVNIPPRRMDFAFDDQTPRYWYDNDAYLSLFWSTLSGLFPEGERFFVDSVRNYRDQITDPVLKAQVAGFIGQEAMHTKEHEAINKAMTRLGIDIETIDRQLGPLLKFVRKITTKRIQLAATCALEHFTATIAEQLLRDSSHAAKGEPAVMGLWFWHALEENEHKTVAFDVYKSIGGNYPERAAVMAVATVLFIALAHMWHAQLLAKEGKLFDFRGNLKGLNYLWGRQGLFTRLAPQYLDYYKPSFHPNDHDTRELLAEWREKLFGANGLLRDQVKAPNGKPLH